MRQLRDQHRTVAQLQGELVSLLEDIGTAEPVVFLRELERMSAELGEHLDHEEESLLPVLAEIAMPSRATSG